MSGQRRPMDVNLSSGSKHWTNAEIEARRRSEPKVKKPKTLSCPKWLSKNAAKLFRTYAKQLLENLPASNLDAGTLARMCDAEWSYAEASRHKSAYLSIASEIMDQEAEARNCTEVSANHSDDGLPPDRVQAYSVCQENIAYWSKQMALFEKIARGCANDLGCTISSRCRLIVPDTGPPEEDPLEQLRQTLQVVHG